MEFRIFFRKRGKFPLPVVFDGEERVCEHASHYLGSLVKSARGYSLQTINHYGKQLKYFFQYLAEDDRYSRMQIDHVVATIPSGVLDQYLAGLRNRKLANRTVRNRDAVLKGFFEWLTSSEAGKVRDASGYEGGLKSPGGKRKMPRFVTADHVVQLVQSLYHESQRCLIHFMYDAGLRVSEVPRILKSDIDALDYWSEEFHYLPLLVRGSKGRGDDNIKERYALISRAVYDRIKRYHSTMAYRLISTDAKPAFLNTERKPISAKAIQKMIADASRRASFQSGTISSHRLRHGTALSILAGESGKDYIEKLVLVQTQFGHSDIRATEAYTHIPPSLFDQVQGNKQVRARFEEAQRIFEKTFLNTKNHVNRRGRKRKC